MPIITLLPIISLLALILVWRTRGVNRALSVALALLSLGFSVWYFLALLQALEKA